MSAAAREPLSGVLARMIEVDGPIGVAEYMAISNARYYASRDPLGSAGDFVTAPEISQLFGELIGVWLVDMWIRAGRPRGAAYVELGPGRGTLARDAMVATRRFGLDPAVHLVEASPALRARQAALVPDACWHESLADVPHEGPLLLVANEFLDALPVRQLVKTSAGWRERMVGLDAGQLVFVAGQAPMDAAVPAHRRAAPDGAIIETSPAAAAVMTEAAARLAEQGGAALFIDYGYVEPKLASTLQAVCRHRRLDPFESPGEADLTALVDFDTLAEAARRAGARPLGIAAQGPWLRALGIEARAARLAAATPAHAAAIGEAVERLAGDDAMGALFKVMGLAHPGWPEPAGF